MIVGQFFYTLYFSQGRTSSAQLGKCVRWHGEGSRPAEPLDRLNPGRFLEHDPSTDLDCNPRRPVAPARGHGAGLPSTHGFAREWYRNCIWQRSHRAVPPIGTASPCAAVQLTAHGAELSCLQPCVVGQALFEEKAAWSIGGAGARGSDARRQLHAAACRRAAVRRPDGAHRIQYR